MSSLPDLNIPPHNIDAEKGLISSILIDNEVLYVIEGLAIFANDFYQKEHQIIFESIKNLWTKRRTIDVITLGDDLTKKGEIELIGGMDYLYEISTFAISASVAYDYAKIIKEKSTLRNILKTCQKTIGDVFTDKETGEILDGIEKRIFELTQVNFSDSMVHIKDVLDGRYIYYNEICEDKSALTKNKCFSGYSVLDQHLNGFKPGELIILAARPSMGKTTFALNIAENIAIQQKKTVAIFSLEMGNEQIADRILTSLSGIFYNKIHKGLLDDDDFLNIGNAMEKLSEANIFIDDKGGVTINEVKSKLRRIKIENGTLDFVIIDYLQLMSGTGMKFDGNRVQEISQITRSLKELARELGVPIMALSQLSRASESRNDKRPQLADLRDSGSIEQDADSVMMLYREDYYDPDDEDVRGQAQVLLRKNRNGPTGEINMKFEKEIMKFVSIETSELEPF